MGTQPDTTKNPQIWKRRRFIPAVSAAVAAAALIWGAAAIRGHYPIVDEKAHLAQTEMFRHGDFRLYVKEGERYPRNAMFPGFHLILAGLLKAIGADGLDAARLACLLFAALIPLAAFLAAGAASDGTMAAFKAGQVFFLPCLFPFLFLVYTDAAGLLALLLALWATMRKKDLAAGLFALLAVFIRHNNVVFAAFLPALRLMDEFGWNFVAIPARNVAKRVWPYAIAIAAVATFVIVNGGPALDDPTSHIPRPNLTNALFALFCYGALFAPLILSRRKKISEWVSARPKTAACALLAVAVTAMTVSPTHRWNQMPWLLHNEILNWAFRDYYTRLVLAVVAAIAALSLAAELDTGNGRLLLFFSFLSLLPVQLVEPRYYIVPFAFATILRTPSTPKAEAVQTALFAALAIAAHLYHLNTPCVI